MPQLILGSTSPFRKALLERLHLDFDTASPHVDETALPGESPAELVLRLAEEKAKAVGNNYPDAFVIGGDQVAVCGDEILGKPGDHDNAVAQLKKISGQVVSFQTALCLYQASSGHLQKDLVPFRVHFRKLNDAMIERYLQKEPAYNCAGSFKSEGFGIVLCDRLEGDDPNALIGLPLIRLTHMLEQAGFELI